MFIRPTSGTDICQLLFKLSHPIYTNNGSHTSLKGSCFTREISGRVPFEQTADLLRAAGYYPSEVQAAEIVEELRYEVHYETGVLEPDLSFDALTRALVSDNWPRRYSCTACQQLAASPHHSTAAHTVTSLLQVNHRPVVGLGPEDVTEAFAKLGAGLSTGLLTHKELLAQLSERAESLGGEELEQCWEALLGPGANLASLGANDISPAEMAEGVLGFAGDEEEEGEDEGGAEEPM